MKAYFFNPALTFQMTYEIFHQIRLLSFLLINISIANKNNRCIIYICLEEKTINDFF